MILCHFCYHSSQIYKTETNKSKNLYHTTTTTTSFLHRKTKLHQHYKYKWREIRTITELIQLKKRELPENGRLEKPAFLFFPKSILPRSGFVSAPRERDFCWYLGFVKKCQFLDSIEEHGMER